jgi:hypothetical protein
MNKIKLEILEGYFLFIKFYFFFIILPAGRKKRRGFAFAHGGA